MAFGLHKPGAGYWTRVMTAALIGIVTLAAAGWGYEQTRLVISRLPASVYTAFLPQTLSERTELKAGSPVKYYLRAEPTKVAGTLTLAEDAPAGSNQPVLTGLPENVRMGDISALSVEESRVIAFQNFEPRRASETLVGGGVVTLILLAGALLAYYIVGVRPGSAEFLINTDYEMKKVNWSTPREIWGSTLVVIFAAVGIALSLFVFDLILRVVFVYLKVLPSST